MQFIEPYNVTILILGLVALTFLLQMLVADVVSIKAGHTPGHPIPADHDSALFRSSRAFSNTNESIAIFILATGFAILSSANPEWLSYGAIVYLAGRVGHMIFYYANLKLLRSTAFTIGLLGIVAILITGFIPWFK